MSISHIMPLKIAFPKLSHW